MSSYKSIVARGQGREEREGGGGGGGFCLKHLCFGSSGEIPATVGEVKFPSVVLSNVNHSGSFQKSLYILQFLYRYY